MLMTNMEDIRKKTIAELTTLVNDAREAVRQERFKDKFSRKSSIIQKAKKEIARLQTELSVRRRNSQIK